MNALQTLVDIVGLPFVAGIDLYATVLVAGLGIRLEWIKGLPPQLDVLAHPAIIAIAGVCYTMEFFADKIPFVSALWDAIHTFIRPLGGAFLALGAASQTDPAIEVLAFLLGGGIALGTHSTKMGVRLIAHKYPEPIFHSAISIAEDVGVVGLLVLAFTHPALGLTAIVILLALMAFLMPSIFRTVSFGARVWFGRIISLFGIQPASVPAWLESYMESNASSEFYAAFAQSVPSVPRLKAGYLVRAGEGLSFVYRKSPRTSKTIPLGSTGEGPCLHEQFLYDIAYFGNEGGSLVIFVLPKDQTKKLKRTPDAGRGQTVAL